MTKKLLSSCFTKSSVALATAVASTALTTSSFAADAKDAKEVTQTVVQEAPDSNLHGLLNLDFGDHYITPRGLDVQDQGLVFQPMLLLFWDLYKDKDGFINDVSLTTGIWNSIHSDYKGVGGTTPAWAEFDTIAGIGVKFAKNWEFDATHLMFTSPSDAFTTSQNLELNLAYHDACFGQFSINPYTKLFIELANTATVGTTQESYNIEVGMDPKYVFKSFPVTLELPSYITFPGTKFYSTSSTVGLVSTAFKATVPLTFIPQSYGHWSMYAQVAYYHLVNDGLVAGNNLLGGSYNERNLVKFSGGISIFF